MVTAYLDNSVTTRPAPAVVSAIRRALEEGFYNPSSLYMPGVEARKEATRQFLDEKSFKPGLGTFDTAKIGR